MGRNRGQVHGNMFTPLGDKRNEANHSFCTSRLKLLKYRKATTAKLALEIPVQMAQQAVERKQAHLPETER